jgi:hypothetical protein
VFAYEGACVRAYTRTCVRAYGGVRALAYEGACALAYEGEILSAICIMDPIVFPYAFPHLANVGF